MHAVLGSIGRDSAWVEDVARAVLVMSRSDVCGRVSFCRCQTLEEWVVFGT